MTTPWARSANASASALLPLGVGPAISAGLTLPDSPAISASGVCMFVATIVATDSLRQGDIDEAADRVRNTGASVDGRVTLDADIAADIFFTGNATSVRATLQAMEGGIDVIVQPAATREKKL